ncbi:MAG: (2Fe-2S)-binding protein [Actinomycetota bacterium]
MSEHYTLRVNGVDHDVRDSWPGESLLDVLRDRLGLLGTKGACEQGECGSCSVLIDGGLVCACLVMAASARGQTITTVEGLAPGGAPSDVQRAFVETGAVQCGFCTPGLIMAVHALIDSDGPVHGESDTDGLTESEVREALAGNLCRCTGYGRILEAVERVVVERRR